MLAYNESAALGRRFLLERNLVSAPETVIVDWRLRVEVAIILEHRLLR